MTRTLDELINSYTWVSTKTKEDKPYCLPVEKKNVPDTTLEKNADMVSIYKSFFFLAIETNLNFYKSLGLTKNKFSCNSHPLVPRNT